MHAEVSKIYPSRERSLISHQNGKETEKHSNSKSAVLGGFQGTTTPKLRIRHKDWSLGTLGEGLNRVESEATVKLQGFRQWLRSWGA